MRTRARDSLAFVVLVCFWVVGSPVAVAQPRPTTAERLDGLAAAVEQLRERTVQIPTLSATVQDLSERIAQLKLALDELERSQSAIPDALTRLDEIRDRMDELTRELEGVKTQVATIEQPSASARSSGGGVTHDKSGFSFLTGDGRFAVTLSGYMHARYQLDIADGDTEESTLRIRRARVGLAGYLGQRRMAYKLVLSGIDAPALLDYYLDYQFSPLFSVRLGQYKTPFTRHFITSSTRRTFLEQPTGIDELRYDRDIQFGFLYTTRDRRVSCYAGIGNGAGANRRNDNLDMDVVVRADAVVLGERVKYSEGDLARSPTPQLMIGAGLIHDLTPMPAMVGNIEINRDVDGDLDIDNVRSISTSVDMMFRYRGFEAVAEFVYRHESFGTILEHSDNQALIAALGDAGHRDPYAIVGQVNYILPVDIRSRKLQIGGRVGRTRLRFLGLGGRSSHVPAGEYALEAGAVVQLYSLRNTRLIGIYYGLDDYTAIAGVDGTGGTRHELIVESQLTF